MGCMKCGRDLQDGQIFCGSCLEDMDRHPVKITAPVLIPARKALDSASRRPVRRKLSAEEQIRRLRRRNKVLSFLLALTLMLAIFFAYVSVLHFMEEDRRLPGQNYSSMETLPD